MIACDGCETTIKKEEVTIYFRAKHYHKECIPPEAQAILEGDDE